IRKIGSHYGLKEMDSLVIYNDRSWYRWSQQGNRTGGSQIDFLMEFGGFSMVESVHKLLYLQGIHSSAISPKNEEIRQEKKMVLPERAENYKRAYAYLIKTRGLSVDVINHFVKHKVLYESKDYHNLVFLGRDKNGKVRFASKRGTMDLYGKSYKGDVAGNDKHYGVNIPSESSYELNVFESAIDAMSYIDITGDYNSNLLALGMLSDHPLETFLEEHPNIKKINFCLDNDKPAKDALHGKEVLDQNGRMIREGGLIEKYIEKGYKVKDKAAPMEGRCKDYNECLIYLKKCVKKDIKTSYERRKRKCI
ncbi:DUF3991 domain-containing protein, partial [uncultured Clostridium sp.]|uniref:DUF3991 domain-containing protein n=1 Tax=uncultured Clostridium sp. TaxID=59620 RepID=UPI0025E1CA47